MLRIKIDHTKCTGCRHCEAVCSMFHLDDAINPKAARIRVFSEGDAYFPVIAGPYTDAKCNITNIVEIGGREYDMCVLCPASCPIKPVFKEPGTEVPLKCDHCGEPATNASCVKWCASGALSLIEVEE